MLRSDRVNLPESQTSHRHDREFFLTYESLPRSVHTILLVRVNNCAHHIVPHSRDLASYRIYVGYSSHTIPGKPTGKYT